ncbi:hypothetical protein [Acidisphaera sp. L21]|jgi:hypothetical protein|uniref:hypothetical protein n=1 Tax=Acidisphaera sp. L21 TaxID=1641851 RepID=UPI00131A62B2|nr:hypothetical protein [Acidisphaera sp. L21]
MRKFAMFATAIVGLAFTAPSYAQPSNSAPQPGLPPGFSAGSQNAQPPRATGDLNSTATTTSSPGSTAAAAVPTTASTHRARRAAAHHRRVRHRRHVAAAKAAATTAPAQ